MVYKSTDALLWKTTTGLRHRALSTGVEAVNCLSRLQERATNLAFPAFCLLCLGTAAVDASYVCQRCQADLPAIKHACRCCGLPLAEPGTASLAIAGDCNISEGSEARLCGRCQKDTPPFDYCIGAYHYASPIRGLIGRFKYRGELAIGRSLALLLAQRLRQQHTRTKTSANTPALLIPVPLHAQRIRERGFNQSVLLAQTLGHMLGQNGAEMKIASNVVSRSRHTTSQKDLNREERYANMRDAFTLNPYTSLPAHIVLVDDVVTSGATVASLAAILKQAGVETVGVWCIARTLL